MARPDSLVLRLLALVTTVLIGVLVPTASAAADPLGGSEAERMERFVREQMAATGVPGVGYAVVERDGSTRQQGTFGHDGDGKSVTVQTPFLWGSVSKPVTATAVLELVEAGRLQLDAPVVTYLPSFVVGAGRASDRITVRQLLNHTSGLPTSVTLTDRFDPARRPADVLPRLAHAHLLAGPGTRFAYSSLNYLVLSAVVEAATGSSFAQVLSERVLSPIGMTGAITTQDEAARRLPPGHRFVFGRAVAYPTPYDPAGASYGYLGGTLQDAVAFASAALGGPRCVLDPGQQTAVFADAVDTGEGRRYGLGWRRSRLVQAGTEMVWHSGAAPGYQAALLLLPERERAVVVLQNAYGLLADRRLLDLAFGLTALTAGSEPAPPTDAGPAYPVTITGLLIVVAGLVGLVLRSLILLSRARARTGLRRKGRIGSALWLLAGVGVLVGVGVLLPAALGIRLSQAPLWAPDVAGLVDTLLVLVVVLLVVRTVLGLKQVGADRRREQVKASPSIGSG